MTWCGQSYQFECDSSIAIFDNNGRNRSEDESNLQTDHFFYFYDGYNLNGFSISNDDEVGDGRGVVVVAAAVAAAAASALAALGEGRDRAAGEHCKIVI